MAWITTMYATINLRHDHAFVLTTHSCHSVFQWPVRLISCTTVSGSFPWLEPPLDMVNFVIHLLAINIQIQVCVCKKNSAKGKIYLNTGNFLLYTCAWQTLTEKSSNLGDDLQTSHVVLAMVQLKLEFLHIWPQHRSLLLSPYVRLLAPYKQSKN